MSKKGFGKLVAFAAISGAVAAGVSYALRYKNFRSDLDKDFHEFEDDGEEDDFPETETDTADQADTTDPRRTDRNYISLHASKDELKLVAKDMAEATKNVLKDASVILSDTAHEAVSAAVDTAQIALNAVKAKRAEEREDNDFTETDLQPEAPEASDAKENISEPVEAAAEETSATQEPDPEPEFLDDDYVNDEDLLEYSRLEPGEDDWVETEEDKAAVSGEELTGKAGGETVAETVAETAAENADETACENTIEETSTTEAKPTATIEEDI